MEASATPAPAAPAAPANDVPSDGSPPKTEATAPKTEAPKTEASAPQRFKTKQKVDGQEVEREYTLDELLSTATQADQIRSASNKRFQEAAELQKRLQTALAEWKKDPFAASKDPVFEGLDLDALAERRLAERYRAELLQKEDPKAYELYKKEQEQAAREAALTERERQWAEQQRSAAEQHAAEQTYATFNQALEKSGLPRDGETLALMAEIALINLDHGLDLSSEELAQATRDRLEGFTTRSKKRFDTLDGDALLSDLGSGVVEKVRKALLAKAKALSTKTTGTATKTEPAEIPDKEPFKYESDASILRRMMRD